MHHYKKVWKQHIRLLEAKLDSLDKDVTAPMKDNRDLPDDFHEEELKEGEFDIDEATTGFRKVQPKAPEVPQSNSVDDGPIGQTGIAPEDIYKELIAQYHRTADDYDEFNDELSTLNHIAFDTADYEEESGYPRDVGDELSRDSAELYALLDPNDPNLGDVEWEDTGRSAHELMGQMSKSVNKV